MTNEEMDIMFHGRDIVEKAKQFNIELDKIEQNNIDYFKSKPPQLPSKENEILANNYIIYTSNGRVMFNFKPGSDLPQSIRDECIEAFKKVYTGATKNSI